MTVQILPDLTLAWFPELPAASRVHQVQLRQDGGPLPAPHAMLAAGRVDAPELGVAVIARSRTGTGPLTILDAFGVEHRAAAVAAADVEGLLARITPAARVGLLVQLLESVPRFFRRNGPDLAAAVRRILGAMTMLDGAVSAAFDLGDGEMLIRSRPPPSAATPVYRVAPDGVRAAPGPIDGEGKGEFRMVTAPAAGSAGPDLLLAAAGASVWGLRLDELRPLPASALLRYVAGLDAGAASGLVRALVRWEAARCERSPRTAAVVEDCAAVAPVADDGGSGPLVCGVDALVPIPGGGVFVQGWLFDPRGRVRGIEVIDCRGRRIPVPELWPIRHAGAAERWRGGGHPVPERPGFVGLADGGTDGPWSVEVVLQSGASLAVAPPPADPDPRRSRDRLLAGLPASGQIDGAITGAVAPAVERLHAAHMARHPVAARVRSRLQIGRPPERPRTSLIVPLYRNLNFLGFQLAAFDADPAMAGVELVYVLDSPEQAEHLEGRLRGEHLIYRSPLTIAVHAANLGFAAAANSGARVASGRDLVFLNSDVVPAGPGWLEPLLAALERPGIGAAGPQLLYLDDSLQFAGLYFDRDADGVWFNRHFAKGYPRGHPAAASGREVPALTGACLAIRRQVFERLGGFDEGFVIGDFEDSDLCLRLRAEGLGCWYEPAAALHHVERQSIDRHEAHGDSVATMVNRWRQQRRWAAAIETLMADRESRWGLPASLAPEIARFP